MTEVCKIMTAMEKKDRSQLFPVFFSTTGGHDMNPVRSRFKTKKYKLFHSTGCSPANGCVGKKVTGLSQRGWIAGDQRDKLQKAQGNPGLKKVRC